MREARAKSNEGISRYVIRWAMTAVVPIACMTPTALAEISFRSGRHSVAPVPTDQLELKLAHLKPANGRRHIVVQFGDSVDRAMRESLKQFGLELLRPLGNHAYFAAIGTDADAVALAKSKGLIGAELVNRDWKLDPRISSGKIPAWARVASQQQQEELVAVYAAFHADVPLAEAKKIASRFRAKVRDQVQSINTLILEIPLNQLEPLANDDGVQWIEWPLPRMGAVNYDNRIITQANSVHSPPYGLSGDGVTVLVYDAGQALADHVDFEGRLISSPGDYSGVYAHPTHVACTIGGGGVANPIHKGMAPGVDLISYGFEYDGSGVFLYTNPGDIEDDYGEAIAVYGADISNNSIGTNTENNGFDCEYQGNYGLTSQLIDTIVRGDGSNPLFHDPFRIVWANGNERTGNRCDVEGYGDYYSTAPPAGAKNHIAVGALNANNDTMTSFSSWGPLDDGRMKPDLSAPGCQSNGDHGVTSCSSACTTCYSTACGTSMAAPTVTGLASLLLEDFRVQFPGLADFRNSTLKILLAHTAIDLGNEGPDYQFGYGSVRVRDAVDFMRTGQFLEDEIDDGITFSTLVIVEFPGSPLKITLAWDDYPAIPNVQQTLVNDLDLRVFSPTDEQQYPWTLNPLSPGSPAQTVQPNRLDNIEQIYVSGAAVGAWRIEVHGFSIPEGPQSFSLCASRPLLPDCNGNRVEDAIDVDSGTSADCNLNEIPDECEPGGLEDCNANTTPDLCDIYSGTSVDCDVNAIPDECETDCNINGIGDLCDIASGGSGDCNGSQVPDECEPGGTSDCNANGSVDLCDIASGTSFDCNDNSVPDECDVASISSPDCNENFVPDECEAGGLFDCNENGEMDLCDIYTGTALDCNTNTKPDDCDISAGFSADCNGNMNPDECDIASESSVDCNGDDVPDECTGQPNPISESIVAQGSRYITVTPSFAEPSSVAIRVTGLSGPASCIQAYVQPDGSLGATAVYQPADSWCRAHIHGPEIMPESSYEVDMHNGTNWTAPTTVDTWKWGDVNNDGLVNVIDIGDVSNAVSGLVPPSTLQRYDLLAMYPNPIDCVPDGVVDGEDLAAASDANGVTPFPCDLRDCNENGVADLCDIASGVSDDCNDNDIPDECDYEFGIYRDCNGDDIRDECPGQPHPFAQSIAAQGSRYITVTPSFASGVPVAIRVRGVSGDPIFECMEQYVQLDGTLGESAVSQTPEEWCRVHIYGPEIVPDTSYKVDLFDGSIWTVPVTVRTWAWGDVNNDGLVNVSDIGDVVDAESGLVPESTMQRYDLLASFEDPLACVPDGEALDADIDAVVSSVAGYSNPCPVPDPFICPTCESAIDCDDGVACTDDGCTAGVCTNYPNDGLCADGLFCNGAESCDALAGCQAGNDPCNDGVACTADSCDEQADSCAHVPNDAVCDDGLFCNGEESCHPTQGCMTGSYPCPPRIPCHELLDSCGGSQGGEQ